jgi:hypothetical protein
MTSPTQPRNTIQLILGMPSPLPHAGMRRFGDKVVVCQWHPVSAAELTGCCARAAPYRWWRGHGGDVGCEEGSEQVALVDGVGGGWEEAVAF